jgi:hypothetical protein
MSRSTQNSCCGLYDGKHRCQDLNCNKREFESRAALDDHMRKYGHVDRVHNVNDTLVARPARLGVNAAVGAELGVDVVGHEFVDELARADALQSARAASSSGSSAQSKKRRLSVAAQSQLAQDPDADVDDKVVDDDDDESDAESESGDDSNESDQANEVVENIVASQREKQTKRRGRNVLTRRKTSSWKLFGASGGVIIVDNKHKFKCFLCGVMVATNKKGSSSNIKDHYKQHHSVLFHQVVRAENERANSDNIKNLFTAAKAERAAKPKGKSGGRTIDDMWAPERADVVPASDAAPRQLAKKYIIRITQILYGAASDTPFTVLGSQLHSAYIAALEGVQTDESKTGLMDMLPLTYAAVEALMCVSSATATVGSIAVDGWSSAMSAPIMGMTAVFVDANWKLCTVPLGLLNLGDMEKTAANQAAVMTTMLAQSKRLDDKFVVHTGCSDNEPSTANAVEIVSRGNSVRCLVHTLSLVMKEDVLKKKGEVDGEAAGTKYIALVLARAHAVSTFVNQRPKVESMLREDQMKVDGVTPDRLCALKVEMPTRWYSQLMVIESYMKLHHNLVRVSAALQQAGDQAPTLLSAINLAVAAEAIAVMNEVRRVGRALEAEQFVTASRASRLLWELYETLTYWSDPRQIPTQPRASKAGDDAALLAARRQLLQSACAVSLATLPLRWRSASARCGAKPTTSSAFLTPTMPASLSSAVRCCFTWK